MLPKDPYMLLSMVNTKLRDEYSSLHDLCASLGEDEETLSSRLTAAGFTYDPKQNQFK
jgi:hypothetical protein